MIRIPYDEIGLGIALICIGMAFAEAEARGRILLVSLLVLSFLLPALITSSGLDLVCRIGRLVLGMICFIYWKYKAAVT